MPALRGGNQTALFDVQRPLLVNRENREADLASELWHPHIASVHDRREYNLGRPSSTIFATGIVDLRRGKLIDIIAGRSEKCWLTGCFSNPPTGSS